MATVTITLTDSQVQDVLSQDGTVAALQTQVNNLTSANQALQGQLDTANGSLATMTADRDAQKTRADAAEARLAQLNSDIDAAQAKD